MYVFVIFSFYVHASGLTNFFLQELCYVFTVPYTIKFTLRLHCRLRICNSAKIVKSLLSDFLYFHDCPTIGITSLFLLYSNMYFCYIEITIDNAKKTLLRCFFRSHFGLLSYRHCFRWIPTKAIGSLATKNY